MKKSRVKRFVIIYGVLLTGFSVYVLLDSFVLPHRYEKVFAASTETPQKDMGSEKPELPEMLPPDNGADRESETDGEAGKETEKENGNSRHPAFPGSHSKEKRDVSASGNSMKKTHVSRTEMNSGNIENSATNSTEDKQIVRDEGAVITLKTERINDTNIHVADINMFLECGSCHIYCRVAHTWCS